MKKAYATIAVFLWLIALTTSAQNMYRNYSSPINVPRPTSAISVVHSNGYVYFFQADGNGNLSVSEIDPLSMNPTGNNKYYQLTLQNLSIFNFYLNGGFENSNGDFVLFGYVHNYTNKYSFYPCPAIIIVSSNLITCVPYYQNIEGKFIIGCSGYNQGGQEVYVFVNDGGDMIAVNAATPSLPNRISLVSGSVYQDNYTDISWDGINNHFIATGSLESSPTGHDDPFVEVFDLSTNFTINSVADYYICDPNVTHSSDYKSMHIQIDGNNLILYYDVERYDNPYVYDIIWLTRIKNFWDINTVFVDESWFYELPNAKLFAKDMIYDYKNNRLNFLGEFNKCREGTVQLLAQVDPYRLSSGIEIGQLGATFIGGTCLNDQPPYVDLAYNDLKMFNLALNFKNPCYPVLIAGVDKQSVLTETYDISLSSCDVPMWKTDTKTFPALVICSLNSFSQPITFLQGISNIIPENTSVSYMCDESNACSHQFGGKALAQTVIGVNPTAEITIEPGRLFVCERFEGVIQYSLYDIAGKLLQQGVTRNGEHISLKTHNGVYLLKATDAKGCQVIKTIVLY